MKLIPITSVPKDELRGFRLSDPQWSRLSACIDPEDENSPDVVRQKLDHAVGMYLWSTFNDRHSIIPSDFRQPFEKMERLSNDLISFLEDYFFPAYLKWPDTLCSDVVKARIDGSEPQNERALILEEPKERTVDDYTVSQRNEFIRIAMTERLHRARRELKLPFLQVETFLQSILDFRAVASQTLEALPNAKGTKGDPYLNGLIIEAQTIYCGAGGKGIYSKNAIFFITLLILYVADFARSHIGEDHASALEKIIKKNKVTEKIKTARRKSKEEAQRMGMKSAQ